MPSKLRNQIWWLCRNMQWKSIRNSICYVCGVFYWCHVRSLQSDIQRTYKFFQNICIQPQIILIFTGELFHACSLSLPKIIFASHGTLDKVQRIKDQTKFIKKVFVYGDEFIGKSYGSFNVFIRNALVPSNEHFDCPAQDKMENVAIIFCSSGTTGIPKAVQLSQNNLWFSLGFLNLWVPDCRFNDVRNWLLHFLNKISDNWQQTIVI